MTELMNLLYNYFSISSLCENLGAAAINYDQHHLHMSEMSIEW